MDSIKPGPLLRCTSMAAAIIVSVNADAFQTVDAHGVHQEKTELSNLFSLFSPFPPVECLSWLECKNLLPIIFHADDYPAVLLRFVVQRLGERTDFRVRQALGRAIRVLSLHVVV